MPDSPFPILGTSVPPLLGRAAVLEKMLNALTKAAPDHLQVVGPRFSGKTVLLHGLFERLRQRSSSPYTATFIWDLGHQTPATDQQFMQRLAQEIGASLRASHLEYAEHLRAANEGAFQDIGEVLDLLATEGVKVLVIMDGFDKPLAQGGLTRNLWDQLRELALKPSLRLVTASRRTLSELIRHPDSQTSDFWNIFNPSPVRVGCFDDADLAAVLESVRGVHVEVGARTELLNATNGFPILMLSVLNTACVGGSTLPVTPEAIHLACDNSFDSLRGMLDALWKDCPPSSQDLVLRLMDEPSVSRAGVPATSSETLVERGFARTAGNRLERPNRLLRRYLEEQPNEGSAIVRLFGSVEDYQKNLKGALERRVEQIVGLDATLKRYLQLGADLLPEHPTVFLSNVRGIVDQAFEMIWKAEIPDRRIPSGWMTVWKRNGERRVDEWETTFPQGVARVRLLNCMTGTANSVRCARHVTKATYALINAVHGFGDFGQHQEGAPVDAGTAYSALHLCIELAAALTRELPRPD